MREVKLKKIVHIITNFSGVGGAEMMLIKLVNEVKGYSHHIISLIDVSEELKVKVENKNVTYTSIGCRGPITLALSALKIKKHLDESSTIITWMYHACFVGGLLKIVSPKNSVFFNIRHSLDAYRLEGFSTKLAIKATKLLSNYADGIIYCSKNAQEQHQVYGYSMKRSIYIANGFLFKQPPMLKPVLSNTFVIGALGRFHEAKNYPHLLNAFSKLLNQRSNVKLVLGGKGVDYKNLEFMQLVKEYKIPLEKIELLGVITDTSKFYSSLNLFVLPSITEGFPNVLVEAMSHSLPVISTNVGDAALIIENVDFIVESTGETLYRKLLEFTGTTDEYRSRVGEENICIVKNKYCISHIAQQYELFIAQ